MRWSELCISNFMGEEEEELQSLPNVEGKKRLEVLHYLIHHLGAASNSLAEHQRMNDSSCVSSLI
jgi:hypothetical protein